MESSECESVGDTDAQQLATVHCTSAQQSGGGSAPATAKSDRLAAKPLLKKRHRAEETTKIVLCGGGRATCQSAQGSAIKLALL